jgi:gamma-glutamylcyclotransferase (GGCT)/AIG2-like uncharacterized protein YtfP
MAADLLFAYGTLMRGFPLHRLLESRAEYVGRSQVAARLFDLGGYPGAVRDPTGVVLGELYRIATPALWTALDSAEGPQYHREEVAVQMPDGGVAAACIYWYRGVHRGVAIPGGDYRAHAPAQSIHHPRG